MISEGGCVQKQILRDFQVHLDLHLKTLNWCLNVLEIRKDVAETVKSAAEHVLPPRWEIFMATSRSGKMLGERSEVRGRKEQQSGLTVTLACWSA